MNTAGDTRLELVLGKVLGWGAAVSATLLAAGLLLELAGAPGGFAARTTGLGLIILMVTPLLRVAASVGEYLLARDWLFAGLTATVLFTLLASLAVAFL
jgi:uncharacterized membrane protein